MPRNYEEELIKENEWLIYKIISKYRGYIEFDDLYQVASIGIIKASRNYKKEMNVKFTTYAYTYVLGEVIKFVNDYRSIKVSKEYQTLYSQILRCKDIMTQKLMKEPTVLELSIFMELDEHVIIEVMRANQEIDSLDKIISTDDMEMKLYEVIGFEAIDLEKMNLSNAIENLSDDEKKLIYAKYYLGNTQQEVGDMYNMHQVEVSRTLTKTLTKLKSKMVA